MNIPTLCLEKKYSCLINCPIWTDIFYLSQDLCLLNSSFFERRTLRSERITRALCLFFMNMGEIISSEQILSHVWPNYSASLGNVSVLINTLRGELNNQNVEIVTIRKKGYMLRPKVRL
ncbi:transcriptional regulator [Aeromonas enteropelogenes]